MRCGYARKRDFVITHDVFVLALNNHTPAELAQTTFETY
jgi:hypothetical protein